MMEEMEIPEAIRETAELPTKSRSTWILPSIIGIIICLGTAGGLLFWLWGANRQFISAPVIKPQPTVKEAPAQSAAPADSSPAQVRVITPKTKPDLLGHLPYSEAPAAELTPIGNNLKLRSPAAAKFKQMQAAAQAAGINLVAISAFRDLSAQEQLFFGVKEQRGQDASKRAEVSAPPGYSEHHTGYAVDLGDGNVPATHVEPDFEQTPAFKWLQENALKYSFELSFPPDNPQGVSYEPWHWRFVGDRHSLETFYKHDTK
ncbi:MAG: M15 family metallopeptidase [Cyanobacteria bacterium J06621_8]